MSEDFYRWYIGDLSLATLETVQRDSRRFSEWELSQGSFFNRKQSYGYEEGYMRQDELMLEAVAQRSIIAEARRPASVGTSVLWHDALDMADALTLLSLSHARYYSAFARERKLGNQYGISWGLVTRGSPLNQDIVPISSLGRFVSEALAFIEGNRNWLKESGFDPSIHWFTQAQISFNTAPTVLEMGLYWIVLEILAGAYADSNRLGITNKKERVKRFAADKGYTGSAWTFLDDVIDGWYDVRCAAFHEGKQSSPSDLRWTPKTGQVVKVGFCPLR